MTYHTETKPEALAAHPENVSNMIGGSRNGFSGTGDLRPAVYRIGSDHHEQYPSRRGNSLFYRDGRVEMVK